MSGRRVVVVGGGLAGITAALDCAQAGAEVTLVEVRRRLGGAAYSFERGGLALDNGQHVFLRCCTAYVELLDRLGSASTVRLQRRLEIPVLSPGRAPAVLRRARLPAPLHLAGALARYPHLTPSERFSAARAARALARLGREQALELERSDARTLGRWLEDHGQSGKALDALWDLVALPTLNLPAREASLALGAFVLQTGLLERADAGDIGFHTRPLAETIGQPALRALRAHGVDVRLGSRVERVARAGEAFEVRCADGVPAADGRLGAGRALGPGGALAVGGLLDEGGAPDADGALSADGVIVAVPHTRAGAIVAGAMDEQAAASFAALGSSPIVNVHVVYDRRVCDVEFAAGVGTPVQYVFDRTDAVGLRAGQYLAVSISAAEQDMQLSGARLRERYLAALAELFPAAGDARVRLCAASREHAATFAARPGVEALRPPARTGVPRLALAGAWTDTGWPATLEGAVRSGHAAAQAVLADE